jgi:hypothetical protein
MPRHSLSSRFTRACDTVQYQGDTFDWIARLLLVVCIQCVIRCFSHRFIIWYIALGDASCAVAREKVGPKVALRMIVQTEVGWWEQR